MDVRLVDSVRIDKWLWAARIFKTRALAAEAIKGGRVHVQGQRAKASKDVRAGDRLEVTRERGLRVELIVRGVAERRGPAKEAALLYEETPESIDARERHAAEMELTMPPGGRGGARPTKRDRRRMEATRGRR
jgi:ribosome-associated heat shock protein Hsp15